LKASTRFEKPKEKKLNVFNPEDLKIGEIDWTIARQQGLPPVKVIYELPLRKIEIAKTVVLDTKAFASIKEMTNYFNKTKEDWISLNQIIPLRNTDYLYARSISVQVIENLRRGLHRDIDVKEATNLPETILFVLLKFPVGPYVVIEGNHRWYAWITENPQIKVRAKIITFDGSEQDLSSYQILEIWKWRNTMNQVFAEETKIR